MRDLASTPSKTVLSLCWFAALAWIQTRDRKFSLEIHCALIGTEKSYGEAREFLQSAIKDRGRLANDEFLLAEEAAEKELVEGLIKCGVEASGADLSGEQRSVNSLSWELRARIDTVRHDSVLILDGPDTGFEQIERLSFRADQVFARWPVELTWLGLVENKRWDADMLVYWVERRSFSGYDPRSHPSGARGRVPSRTNRVRMAPDGVLKEIRNALRLGLLQCGDLSRRKGAEDAEVRGLPEVFWMGHGLRDVASACFDNEEALKIWPLESRLIAQFESRQEFIGQVMFQLRFGRERATWLADTCRIQPAKRGPKPRAR